MPARDYSEYIGRFNAKEKEEELRKDNEAYKSNDKDKDKDKDKNDMAARLEALEIAMANQIMTNEIQIKTNENQIKTNENQIKINKIQSKTNENQSKTNESIKKLSLLSAEHVIRIICGEFLLHCVGAQPKRHQEKSVYYNLETKANPNNPKHSLSIDKVNKVMPYFAPFLPKKHGKAILDKKINDRVMHCRTAAKLKEKVVECVELLNTFPELKKRLRLEFKILSTYDTLRSAKIL